MIYIIFIHIGGSMELRTIDTFLKVAATQNFSKAAEQLGYSQSAVTVQMQKLEKELETQLFERIGKRVFLTEKGQEFVHYANEIKEATNLALSFSKQEETPKGKLRIGGVESICTALLPELLLEFYKLCPEVEVVIHSGTTDALLELAAGNNLDLVFTLDHKIYCSEWNCPIQEAEDVIFVTLDQQHRFTDKIVKIQELIKEPFLLTENGAAYHYELEQMLAELNLEISPILEIGNTETIIHLLKRGMGISFLPKFTVSEALKNQVLSEIHTNLPKVKMYHQLFYHKNKWMTKQMQIFIQLVADYFNHRSF